jgi:serine protease AprX
MKKFLSCIGILLTLSLFSKAQNTRYIIQFRNKGSNPYSLSNPSAYLSQRALDRRTKYSILIDSTDLPVTPGYVDSIRLAGAVTLINLSKWLNSVSIQTTDAAALAKINNFPFVQSVKAIAARTHQQAEGNKIINENQSSQLRETGTASNFFDYGNSLDQVHIHNGEFLHNIGLRGQNMIIGMLDAGFLNYRVLKAFDSVRANGQILGVYDFVAKDSSVNEDDAHGMECFSTMASNIPGRFVGTAPKSGFYLFRTEDASSEYPIEEHNWVCGAERIDSAGGDVISSSLGYSDGMSNPAFDHTYAEMNGNTTMAAIGADLAAKKGILVVNSAGNEGDQSFHFISTPADGDSVLAVGAVTASGVSVSFSSYGPSSDGQVKPDVASVGFATVIALSNNNIGTGNGTSFACPNLAGLVTCLWQGFPEFNNMKIINALRQAGSKASAPDNRVGYGIPDVKKAVLNLLKEYSNASATVSNCTATLQWTSKDVSSMKYEIERLLPGQSSFVKIGEQEGTGSVFSAHSPYQFQDDVKGYTTVSYRVRQIIDSSASGFAADYLDTVSINLQNSCIDAGLRDVLIFPNPANGQFSVRLTTPNASSDIVIRIFASNGQLVAELKKSKLAGTMFFDSITLGNLAKGKYYVTIYEQNKLIATKELINQ